MSYIARNDPSIIGRWWHEVDRGLIGTTLILILAGVMVMFTGSAQEALQSDDPLLRFSIRKAVLVLAGLGLILLLSLAHPKQIEQLTPLGFMLALAFMLSIFVAGAGENGAVRWVTVPGLGFTPQPSEFAKPMLVLMLAYCLARIPSWGFARALATAFGCFASIATLIFIQPDVSQTIFLTLVFLALVYLAGLSFQWVLVLISLGGVSAYTIYRVSERVRERVDGFITFLQGQENDNPTQIEMIADAFREGGVEGVGFGEGHLKTKIPEVKNDMPLAIIGEETGIIGALVVFGLFFLVWSRTQARLKSLTGDFQRLAAAGLAFLFVGQALTNILYTVGILPPTGITLPFFSDGGSSLIASSIIIGLLLSMTRQRGANG